jgi:hypothetical protein
MKVPLPRNPISLAGVFLATIGALFFLIFFLTELFGWHSNPYMGILIFVILPVLFIAGLLLIPIGAWRERRAVRMGRPERTWPRIDFNNPRHRNVAFFVAAATFVNVLIVSLAAYGGVHYMDSNEFCGKVCHSVMQPEYSAFLDSPHSRVGCAGCHISPGAAGFAKAKMSGLRQLKEITFGTYAKPVPAPVHNLPPAADTCEGCHWPEKFHGDKIKIIREYSDDETNTESATTLDIHIGGGSAKLDIASGIHWHMNIANRVEFVSTDEKRQVIPYVKVTDRTGAVREYFAEGVTAAPAGERRVMECTDCHNRPGHLFDASADKAVNRALATGLIPKTLPFIKREAAAALNESYPSAEEGEQKIGQRLRDFYAKNYANFDMKRKADVDRAVTAAQALYRRNIYPSMNITWGTYPNNLGHMDFPGCFRCHDDTHKTKDGKAIGQDCALCHEMK